MKVFLGTLLLAAVALSTPVPIKVNGRSNAGDSCQVPGTEEDNLGLYAPHPTDCNQFLVCDNGVFRALNCDTGLHWNAEDQACDWPSNANCENGGTSNPVDPTNPTNPTNPTDAPDPTDPANPTNPTDPANPTDPTDPANPTNPTNPTDPNNPTNPTDPTDPEGTWAPPTTPDGGWTSCPALDPLGYTIHIQHPDCSLYYVCDNGVARERPCPPGLQWNNDEWACDWPNLANCVDGAVPEIPGAIPVGNNEIAAYYV